MINLLLFYTEGGEHDPFRPMDTHKLNIILKEISANTKVNIFTPRTLVDQFAEAHEVLYSGKHISSNHQTLNINKEWEKINNQTWKPFLISRVLNNLDDGEILFYHDCDLQKYPEYEENIKLSEKKIRGLLGNKDVLLFCDNGMKMYNDCKSELLRSYDLLEYQSEPHVWSGAMILKKTATSTEFILDWYNLHKKSSNASQDYEPSLQHRDFIWHTVDQATLGCTFYSWRKLNKADRIIFKNLRFGRVIGKKFYNFRKKTIRCFENLCGFLK